MPCRYSESIPATTGRRRLDGGGVDAQHFADAVDDDADDLVADLDHDDAAGAGVVGGRQAEAAAQIDDRNHFAAQVDDTLDEGGRARARG